MATISNLVDDWREEAKRIRDRYGEEPLARLCEAHAHELEDAIATTLDEELPVDAAAAESGYSESQIRRLFPGGRIRRRDLPRKARRSGAAGAAALGSLSSGVSMGEEVCAGDEITTRLDRRLGRTG